MNIYNKLYQKAKNFLFENSKILHNYFWPTNVLYLHLYIDLYTFVFIYLFTVCSLVLSFLKKNLYLMKFTQTYVFVISCFFFVCCPHSYRHTLHD